jgi:hypothetical protein
MFMTSNQERSRTDRAKWTTTTESTTALGDKGQGATVMPPLPEALAHVSTDPAAEVLYVPLPFGQLVVIPPPFDVALPLLTQLLTGLALSRVPEFVF